MKNSWLDAVMGVVVGDALGCPVQFMSRAEIARRPKGPVTGMEGHGTYNKPEGTWTDDGSMTLALLDSIREKNGIDLDDIMSRFVAWYEEGAYTPFGKAFDMGNTCSLAIELYEKGTDVYHCGGTGDRSNGNGSLMRILPVCLYCYERQKEGMTDEKAIDLIHAVSGLTHNHLRSRIACGLYFFMIGSILDGSGSLLERLQAGVDAGFAFYDRKVENKTELAYYGRLRDLSAFSVVSEDEIRSSGYVVDTLEAAIWCLITTDSFKDCLLKVVNLGEDTDTVGAVAGGLAGLYYGYDAIPYEWLDVIQRREWVEGLCRRQEGDE